MERLAPAAVAPLLLAEHRLAAEHRPAGPVGPVGAERRLAAARLEAPPADRWPIGAGEPLAARAAAPQAAIAVGVRLRRAAARTRLPPLPRPSRRNRGTHRKPGELPARTAGKST